jgi:class 3 adenylate cyclase
MPAVRATLLFTDIVGSTRHAVEMGDRAWRDLLEWHDRLVRREVANAGGRVIKNLGDGYFIGFEDADAAVAAAHALVDIARSLGFEIRAGLHSGEVECIGDDPVGLTVHIAARVSAMAGPGSVLSTTAVVLAARPESDGMVDRGLRELRDVPGHFRLFESRPLARAAA